MDQDKLSEVIRKLYIDWKNNFLTIERFAEYYGISFELAAALLKEGKQKVIETGIY